MLDAFTEVLVKQASRKEEEDKLTELMLQLPVEEAAKFASAKVACFDDDKSWTAKYEGTPLYNKALDLEEASIQMEEQDMKRRAEQRSVNDQAWDSRDALRIKKKILDLELSRLNAECADHEEEGEEEEEGELKHAFINAALGGVTGAMQGGPGHRLEGAARGAIGSGLGGLAGAKGGAMAGAALGSIVPGIGTAIGGVAGGVLGGLAGAMGGQTLAMRGLEKKKAMQAAGAPNQAGQAQPGVAQPPAATPPKMASANRAMLRAIEEQDKLAWGAVLGALGKGATAASGAIANTAGRVLSPAAMQTATSAVTTAKGVGSGMLQGAKGMGAGVQNIGTAAKGAYTGAGGGMAGLKAGAGAAQQATMQGVRNAGTWAAQNPGAALGLGAAGLGGAYMVGKHASADAAMLHAVQKVAQDTRANALEGMVQAALEAKAVKQQEAQQRLMAKNAGIRDAAEVLAWKARGAMTRKGGKKLVDSARRGIAEGASTAGRAVASGARAAGGAAAGGARTAAGVGALGIGGAGTLMAMDKGREKSASLRYQHVLEPYTEGAGDDLYGYLSPSDAQYAAAVKDVRDTVKKDVGKAQKDHDEWARSPVSYYAPSVLVGGALGAGLGTAVVPKGLRTAGALGGATLGGLLGYASKPSGLKRKAFADSASAAEAELDDDYLKHMIQSHVTSEQAAREHERAMQVAGAGATKINNVNRVGNSDYPYR